MAPNYHVIMRLQCSTKVLELRDDEIKKPGSKFVDYNSWHSFSITYVTHTHNRFTALLEWKS